MQEPFNSVRYLRRISEQAARAIRPDTVVVSNDAPPTEAAAALVTVDAVSAEIAHEIIWEYPATVGIDRLPGEFSKSPSIPRSIGIPRIVLCNKEIVERWGRIHVDYITLDDNATSMVGSAVVESHAGEGVTRDSVAMTRGRLPVVGRPQITMGDDRGVASAAQLNGTSTLESWSGRMTTERPLSRSTRWIAIDGKQLDLGHDTLNIRPVRLEPLTETEQGEAYLWNRIACSGRGPYYRPPRKSFEAIVGALLGAGAFEARPETLANLKAVMSALTEGAHAPYEHLPQPWASLISRLGQSDGRPGAVVVGAVTPPVDGIVICIEGLVACDPWTADPSGPIGGFNVHVVTSPGVGFAPHPAQIDRPRIGWWAVDNLGNYYLGSQGNWQISKDGGLSLGTVLYQPALHPEAEVLFLMPTGITERAVIPLTGLPGQPSKPDYS